MPSTVPTPVAAALGIVPTVFDGMLRLPGKAITLPIYAISSVPGGVQEETTYLGVRASLSGERWPCARIRNTVLGLDPSASRIDLPTLERTQPRREPPMLWDGRSASGSPASSPRQPEIGASVSGRRRPRDVAA